MKTVDSIRRENLRGLTDELSVQAVADRLGKAPSQVSQWLNASPDSKTGKPRNMSGASAREIERAFNKPEGWMDTDRARSTSRDPGETRHSRETAPADTPNAQVQVSLETTLRVVERICTELGHELSEVLAYRSRQLAAGTVGHEILKQPNISRRHAAVRNKAKRSP